MTFRCIDYAVEIQIFDFVLWENLFCSTLDSLVTIAEPEGEEKSAFKSKLMLGAIEIATSEDNMWEVDEATYRDVSFNIMTWSGLC